MICLPVGLLRGQLAVISEIEKTTHVLDVVIDKCYTSHMRRKFLEKKEYWRWKIFWGLRGHKKLLFPGESDGVQRGCWPSQYSWCSTSSKMCFTCGKDGYFSRDKRCPARGETCRKCGSISHFKARCPQIEQRGGGELRGAASSSRIFPSRCKGVARRCKVFAGGRFQGEPGDPNWTNRSKSNRQPKRSSRTQRTCSYTLNIYIFYLFENQK